MVGNGIIEQTKIRWRLYIAAWNMKLIRLIATGHDPISWAFSLNGQFGKNDAGAFCTTMHHEGMWRVWASMYINHAWSYGWRLNTKRFERGFPTRRSI